MAVCVDASGGTTGYQVGNCEFDSIESKTNPGALQWVPEQAPEVIVQGFVLYTHNHRQVMLCIAPTQHVISYIHVTQV